jgi:hypothetical protein
MWITARKYAVSENLPVIDRWRNIKVTIKNDYKNNNKPLMARKLIFGDII